MPTPTASRDTENGPLVAAFFQAISEEPPAPRTTIHPSDEMLKFLVDQHRGDRDQGRAHYFRSGRAIADAYLQIIRWHFGGHSGGIDQVDSLLDFASGFGRVTRFLLDAIPANRLWVSDLYDEGVAFQKETLGVQGFSSTIDPADLECDERFDVILATSLFSHLRADRFHSWLERLTSLLTERGLLIFSVHDAALLPPEQSLPPEGIFFRPISESASHDAQDYGSAWVSEDFVRLAVQRLAALDEDYRLIRLPRGLCNFQDLYVIAKGEQGSLHPPNGKVFEGDPHFFLESCDIQPGGQLRLTGWAAESARPFPPEVPGTSSQVGSPEVPGTSVEGTSVEVWLGGRIWGRTEVNLERPEVEPFTGRSRCGWALEGAVPADFRPTDPLVIRLFTPGRPAPDQGHNQSQGQGHVVHVATVVGSSLGCCEQRLRWLQEELHRRESRWAAERDEADRRHGADVAAAKDERRQFVDRLGAMEASRFWKLRNAWFALKEKMGLGERPE